MKRVLIIYFLLIITSFVSFSQEKEDALKLCNDGKYKEAISVCLEELKERPKNMDSYVVMGWSLLAMGNYQEVLVHVKKALAISPYDSRNIEIMGEALFYLGKNREALKYFEQYTTITPTGQRIAKVYFFMGEIYIRLGEYNNADISFSTALHFKKRDAYYWFRLGYAREMGKDYKYSLKAYENALKFNPNFKDAKRGVKSVKKKMTEES